MDDPRSSVQQPKSILRGHRAAVHAAAFVHANTRLLTGDADGFVVAWDITIMRPRAVWQAHAGSILGLCAWGGDRIITHGRDRTLVVWKLAPDDEACLSTSLPLDQAQDPPRPLPPLLYLLQVNTMNFCPFAPCPILSETENGDASSEMLIAVPNTLASGAMIEIFHLPSQTRRHTVKLDGNSGMVMALSLLSLPAGSLTLVAGFEDGTSLVAQLGAHLAWSVTYRAKSHTQPVLSLDVAPTKDFFLTSSADATIARHPIQAKNPDARVTSNEEHGQQKARTRTLPDPSQSLLAAAFTANNAQLPPVDSPSVLTQKSLTSAIPAEPSRIVNTKHAGQQSLRIRSDGRIFATAGWDARVRVYSTKSLNEVAVLKWHQAACYATAFADLSPPEREGGGLGGDPKGRAEEEAGEIGEEENNENGTPNALATVPNLVSVKLRDKRVSQAKEAHWLAAGSKDGRVSLWHVF